MKGKKSNRLMTLGVLTLVVSIISCSMVGGAFAKYTTTVSGTDTARVAKFAFDLMDDAGDDLIQEDGTMRVNLLDMVDEDAVLATDAEGTKLIAPGTMGSFSVEVENQSEVAITAAFKINEKQINGSGDQISGRNPAGTVVDTTEKTLIPVVYSVDLGTDEIPDVRYYSSMYQNGKTIGGETIAGDLNKMAEDMATASAEVLMWPDSGVAGAIVKKNFTINWYWAFEGNTGNPNTDSADELQSDELDTLLGQNMALTADWDANLATSIEVDIGVVVSQVDDLPEPEPDPEPEP